MLEDTIESVRGVGPSSAVKFNRLGVRSVRDLIYMYPRRYEDYSQISPILKLKPGTPVTVQARIVSVTGRYVRRGLHITEALASDTSGSVKIVWFNQPYRPNAIKSGKEYFISGNFEMSRGRLAIMNPHMELVSDVPVSTARIVPIYKETKGLSSLAIRKAIREVEDVIDGVADTLPSRLVASHKLMPLSEALKTMHFPSSMKSIDEAKRRLGFDEILGLILASQLNKQQFQSASGVSIPFDESVAREFVGGLSFALTNAQRKVAWQIFKDMQSTEPMNRLVEGDVGSGKTVVAALASIMAIHSGYQLMMMAPTEILAMQHYQNLLRLMSSMGKSDQVGLLLGSMTKSQKTLIKKQLAANEIKFLVGTHALITDDVDLHNLGLVIIDEQHRFGVKQRKALQEKASRMPHVLHMTATPIPRTLALTIYGELDISIIDEMPPGRQPIITELVSPNSRTDMYQTIQLQIAEGRQVFVVCPLIEESEKIPVYSAEKVHKELQNKFGKTSDVGLLHGKMKNAEKEEIMAQFVAGEIDILVSTTVVEVGVDVPNASVMVVEAAERFGLAQLHQLRGRVGRGRHQSYCFLVMSDSKSPPKRLQAMENISNGFELAEIDLELRGPGAIYGVIQSGQLDLKIANITDSWLIALARQSAVDFMNGTYKLKEYPDFNAIVQKNRTVTNLN